MAAVLLLTPGHQMATKPLLRRQVTFILIHATRFTRPGISRNNTMCEHPVLAEPAEERCAHMATMKLTRIIKRMRPMPAQIGASGSVAARHCARARPPPAASAPMTPRHTPHRRRRWDALPCDVLTHVVGLLRSGADQAAAAAACRAWQRVSDAALRDIRRAPLGQLPRLLARFPGATRATICDAASPAPPGGASAVAAALLACPRAPHALLFSASHAAAADGLFALATSGPAGAAWAAQLTSLELDLTFAMRLPDGLGAALPRLRSLELRAFRGGGHALGAVLGCARLRALRLAGLYCGALPGLEALTRLAAVGIVSCYNLREAPELPACVKVRSGGAGGRGLRGRAAQSRSRRVIGACAGAPLAGLQHLVASLGDRTRGPKPDTHLTAPAVAGGARLPPADAAAPQRPPLVAHNAVGHRLPRALRRRGPAAAGRGRARCPHHIRRVGGRAAAGPRPAGAEPGVARPER